MKLALVDLIFMGAWLTIFGLATLFKIIQLIRSKTLELSDLFPLGMFIVGYVVATGAFKYESSKSKKFLANIFQSEEMKTL